MEQAEENIVGVNQQKPTRKKSSVWEYFTIEATSAGCIRACCNQCKKTFSYFSGSKLSGTSHLKRHITLGICPKGQYKQQMEEKSQLNLHLCGSETNNACPATEPQRKRHRADPKLSKTQFNQDLCNLELAKMIILQEHPLHIVEHREFVQFVRTLQPLFDSVTVDIIQEKIMCVYHREKKNQMNILAQSPGRVNLTFDLWRSDRTLGYILVTGHYVDSNFKLHRQILNVIMVPWPDSDFAVNQAVHGCFLDWNLENKLFSVILGNSFPSPATRENLRSHPFIDRKNILKGQLLILNCYANNLTRLAQDALLSINQIVVKVRRMVKYVKTSRAIEANFKLVKENLALTSAKSLIMDDATKWNTTYHMLTAACELKGVFSCLHAHESNYETPSVNEWNQVETLCIYLKRIFEASNILVGGTNLTANVFFHEIWKLQFKLIIGSISTNSFENSLTKSLLEKFDKSWSDAFLVMAIAVVMDPRYKMKLVKFCFSKIYGQNAEMWIRTVEHDVVELFLEYAVLSLPPTFVGANDFSGVTTEFKDEDLFSDDVEEFSDFDLYISNDMGDQEIKSELDQYLEDPLLPPTEDFDVLAWWESRRYSYPILSRMAFDVLSIPFSAVALDAVFDTTMKKMDGYRSSLRPETVQALICSKDWLASSS